jgi:membrane fusion protein (multidrug efflux system)
MTSEVRPQISSIILKRLFTEGSEVKEGQSLYEIDPCP